MKKQIVLLLAAALILSLTACGKSASQNEQTEPASDQSASESQESSENAEPSADQLVGGWTINDDETKAVLPKEVQAAFDKAIEGLVGNGLTPVAYIGKQVVSGANYAILCKSVLVTAEPVTSYQVVIVYEDLQGNAEIRNIADFNLADYTEGDGTDPSTELPGGWSVPEEYTVVNMPAEVQEAFDGAAILGNTLEPMAYLGSQLVSGTNYAVLCHSTLTTADPVSSIQLVTVYKDLEGKSKITNIHVIDPAKYNE